jgi:hypothetical protein
VKLWEKTWIDELAHTCDWSTPDPEADTEEYL